MGTLFVGCMAVTVTVEDLCRPTARSVFLFFVSGNAMVGARIVPAGYVVWGVAWRGNREGGGLEAR